MTGMENSVLLEKIEAYCEANKVSLTTFGRKAVNDGKLVDRLRSGRTITLQTYSRLTDFLSADEHASSDRTRHVNGAGSALPAESGR